MTKILKSRLKYFAIVFGHVKRLTEVNTVLSFYILGGNSENLILSLVCLNQYASCQRLFIVLSQNLHIR